MLNTPRANRLHIGLFGRRNAGKSSLINMLTGQSLAIVSAEPGTTADPVLKSMELLPLGPVVFIDTAGLDDEGDLGALRAAKSREMMTHSDLALLVIPVTAGRNIELEIAWLEELKKHKIPVLGVLSQSDWVANPELLQAELADVLEIPFVTISSETGAGRSNLLLAMVEHAPRDFERATLLGDLFEPKAPIILVAPQDLQAPKGRLILPQVQTIRDILDHDGMVLVVKDTELPDLLNLLKTPPALVVTDSQIFPKVEELLGPNVPLTSFSILMARYKGDLATFIRGARKIATLTEHDKVLIAEACTHHALEDDIGREKIPRWLRQKVGQGMQVDIVSGFDFPENLGSYDLIIHCGGCMFTRKQLMSRLIKAEAEDVPMTNYGVAIAALNGMLVRVTSMFPEAEEK